MSVLNSYLEKVAYDPTGLFNDQSPPPPSPVSATSTNSPPASNTSRYRRTLNYIKGNPYKSGAMVASGLAGAYGAKKLYDRFKGKEKTAAYEYVLNKVAAITSRDDGRETHTGKVLGGLGIAGLGALTNRAGNIATDNANFYQQALDPKTDAATVAAVRKRFADNVKGGDKLDQATLDKVRNVAKRVKHVGKGAMGLGALLGGYGAYKNYQGSKNDPINMPSDATIRRHMKG